MAMHESMLTNVHQIGQQVKQGPQPRNFQQEGVCRRPWKSNLENWHQTTYRDTDNQRQEPERISAPTCESNICQKKTPMSNQVVGKISRRTPSRRQTVTWMKRACRQQAGDCKIWCLSKKRLYGQSKPMESCRLECVFGKCDKCRHALKSKRAGTSQLDSIIRNGALGNVNLVSRYCHICITSHCFGFGIAPEDMYTFPLFIREVQPL